MLHTRVRIPFQFSLKAVLGFFVVLGSVLGWLSYEFRRARMQREYVAKMEKAGGYVLYSWESVTRNRNNSPWLAELRTKLFGHDFLTTVDGIDLSGTGITDDELAELEGFPSLEYLRLANTHVSDEGARHLTRLKNLKRLDLVKTDISDSSISHLSRMKSLRLLYVYKTRMSPDGVANLRISLPECDVVY